MRAGSGLCAGRENGRNAVPEGGSAAGLTATIGPWTMVRWVPGGPGPCLNFISATLPTAVQPTGRLYFEALAGNQPRPGAASWTQSQMAREERTGSQSR